QREASQLDRCAAMWFHWNTAALPYVNTIVRHEALIRNAGVLLDSFGIEANVDVHQIGVVNDKSHEKRRQFATPEWEDIRPERSREVRRLAQSHGYYDCPRRHAMTAPLNVGPCEPRPYICDDFPAEPTSEEQIIIDSAVMAATAALWHRTKRQL